MKAALVCLTTAGLLCSSGQVIAASSVDLSVTGLITPSACTTSLTNGGTVDFGKIPAKDLSADDTTLMPEITLKLSVNCEAATLFALRSTDNRRGTAYLDDGYGYGFGVINGNPEQKLGTYTLMLKNAVSDTAEVRPLFRQDGSDFWWDFGGAAWLVWHHIVAFGNTASGAAAPVALRTVTADLEIFSRLAPSRGLDLSEEVELDGSATVDLIYL